MAAGGIFATLLAVACVPPRAPVGAPLAPVAEEARAVPTPADSAVAPRFYFARPYGSEAQFNPVSQVLNEGFNTLLLVAEDLRLRQQPFQPSLRNLGQTMQHIGPTLNEYGWRRLVRNELLPLTAKEGGQWVPNWLDHLMGSGMVSARLAEWYRQHQVPHPAVMSYLTMTVSHVLNEVVERPGPRSADPVVDLLLFNNLGFVLFRNQHVQRWLSGPVQFTSWGRQPTLSRDGALENAGQSFVLRTRLPGTQRWQFFYLYGNTHLVGASRRLGGSGLALSAGAGWGSEVLIVTDAATDTRTVTLGPKAGMFLDRNASLLASIVWDRTRRSLLTLNVYPAWSAAHAWQPGVWVGVPERGGHWQLGVVSRLGVGVGLGRAERRR